MSTARVAREIAAVSGTSIKTPSVRQVLFRLCGDWTGTQYAEKFLFADRREEKFKISKGNMSRGRTALWLMPPLREEPEDDE